LLPGASASICARKAGSRSRASFAASGSAASSRQLGWVQNGFSVASKPNISPTGRPATCARIGSPDAAASSIQPSSLRQPFGDISFCTSDTESGRPLASTSRRSIAISRSESVKSDTNCSTPLPAAPSARAMPSSSSSAAVSVGVGCPSLERWLSVREVEKPSAPASTASAAIPAMAAMSAAVAGSRSAPRLPITYTRSAA